MEVILALGIMFGSVLGMFIMLGLGGKVYDYLFKKNDD